MVVSGYTVDVKRVGMEKGAKFSGIYVPILLTPAKPDKSDSERIASAGTGFLVFDSHPSHI